MRFERAKIKNIAIATGKSSKREEGKERESINNKNIYYSMFASTLAIDFIA